ncbi:MAG: hypothetical protein JWR80_8551 [Bradyrhizobium sp.]|nr:hypothetical protein [Bradyrhizobium sp.]
MSLGNCIPGMVERGEIDPARAKQMKENFDELEAHYGESMGPEAAAAEASEETLRQLTEANQLKKRQTLLQAAAQKRARVDLSKYKGGSSYAAVRAMMDFDILAPYENVTLRAQAIEHAAHGGISGFIERHRRNLLGNAKDRAGIDDMIREINGQSTGNARAKLFADSVANEAEGLRQRFNAAGGNIRKLNGWGITHQHDALKVRAVPYETWRADIREGLDIAAMRDPDTGGPLTSGRLEELLRGGNEAIRTGGLIAEPADPFMNQPKLANARSAPRTFVFKDGDAWLAYDRKYGSGNPFNAIMGHFRGMAEDIAALERFGPNPDATVKFLLDSVDRMEAQSAKPRPGAITGTSGGRLRTENLWKYIRGEFNAPVFAEGFLEKPSYWAVQTLAGTRDILTSALLGSSPLSAISDMNTQIMARSFAGLPQTNVLLSYLKQLNPASAVHRKAAIRLDLGMRDASRSLLGLSRYLGETHGPAWTSVVADDVLRLSLLNKFTEGGQRAYGLDAYGTLADHRAVRFEALPGDLREGMERFGITAEDWEHIRAAEPERVGKAEWVSPRNVADRQAADRLRDYVFGGMRLAVPETNPSAQALILAGTRPGTITGEFLRNSFQFKGFAVGLMLDQAKVLMSLGPYRAAVYGARFFVGMTMFGAASIQLREIAKGRDPRPMDNLEFWEDAALQGGGIGIFGDIIGSFKSDRIDSLAQFALGPMYGLISDLKKQEAVAAPHTTPTGVHVPGNPGRAAVTMLKRYTPGGNIWYLRLAYERLVLDALSQHIDPHYDRQRIDVERWARENNQGEWWRAGDPMPERAPDMANAAGH